MDAPTLVLHLALIRLLKGCLSAYERWVKIKARRAGLNPNRPAMPLEDYIEHTLPEGRPEAASQDQQPEHYQVHTSTGSRSGQYPRDSQGRPQ